MNLEIREPRCQSHFLSLRFSGSQFSWRRVLGQKDFGCLAAHCGGTSQPGHVACTPCRTVTEIGASVPQKQKTPEQVTASSQGWDGGSPRLKTTRGSPRLHLSFARHIFIQERNTGKKFLLLLVTAFNCKKITTNIHRNMPFALLSRPRVFPGVSEPNSWAVATVTGAPVLTSK